MKQLNELLYTDYSQMEAKAFADFIVSILKNSGKVKREVWVDNRYDERKGRVDIVFETETEKIGIEIDRVNPRKKSIFKLKQLNVNRMFVFTRAPFNMIEIYK